MSAAGPLTVLSGTTNAPLVAGVQYTTSQNFTFQLPASPGDECPADTATGHNVVYSYIAADDGTGGTAPGALTLSNGQLSPLGSLITSSNNPWGPENTDVNTGEVPVLPNFNFEEFVGSFEPTEALANAQNPPDLYPGIFDIGIACVDENTGNNVDRYWNQQIVLSPVTGDSSEFTWTLRAASPTTTTLTAAPAATSTAGTAVTLTATVSPAAAPGTVQFFDGSEALDATPINPVNGVATLKTTTLGVGNDQLEAKFVAAAETATTWYSSSDSTQISYVVTASTSGSSTTSTTTSSTSTTTPTGSTSTTSTTTASGTTTSTTVSSGGSGGNADSSGSGGTTAAASDVVSADPVTTTLAATGAPVAEQLIIGGMLVMGGLFLLSFAIPPAAHIRRATSR